MLICYGGSRHEAIERMKVALNEYRIDGVQTTIPFHLAALHNKNFIRGRVTTSFIEKNDILKEAASYSTQKNKEITKEQKIILVTTAVSKYLERKKPAQNNKQNPWVMSGRQELMEHEPHAKI